MKLENTGIEITVKRDPSTASLDLERESEKARKRVNEREIQSGLSERYYTGTLRTKETNRTELQSRFESCGPTRPFWSVIDLVIVLRVIMFHSGLRRLDK
ncbi:hypothetical protein EYC84_004890 [Monilinia fructicola]|uniref:Uncharacterized protein n=1 Tax=Monilinia fructicola TaxID=38448 RepID=A0A5M9KA65_MONFR|nr:hypothetical protein EYC84_004890 [Monilinia fructicola]